MVLAVGCASVFTPTGYLATGYLPASRHPGGMNQAEEDGEVGEEVFVEHAFEIEFDEALADEAGGVAQEPQDASVGGDAVEVLGEVEVFLHEGMGRHAGTGAVVAAFVEAVVPAE